MVTKTSLAVGRIRKERAARHEAELAALRAEVAQQRGMAEGAQIVASKLAARVAELEADAERYRHLKLAMGGEHDEFLIFWNDPSDGDMYPLSGDEIDNLIDAARATESAGNAREEARRG